MAPPKRIDFIGNSLADLRAFPAAVRRHAGYQLGQIQLGLEPDSWKPMTSVGPGVAELRIRDEHGAFRIIYFAKFTTTLYVLHCFQKKSQRTRHGDIELARRRYHDMLKGIVDD